MPAPIPTRTPPPPRPAATVVPATVDQTPPARQPAALPGPAAVAQTQLLVGNAAVTATLAPAPSTGLAPLTGRMLVAAPGPGGNTAATAVATKAVTAPAAGTVPAAAAPALPAATAPAGTAPADRAEPAKGAGPAAPAGRRSPAADPKFQALKKDVGAKKRTVASSHPPATTEAGSAQAAAVPPADDREARGKVAHAEDMNAAQPKEFDKAAFIQAVEQAIAAKAPKNLDDADKFGDSGKAEEVKGEVRGKVGEGKDASAKEVATTTAQVPAPAPDAKPVVPMSPDKPPGQPATPNPDHAVPDRLPSSATDMSAGPTQVNRQMADAQVTEDQLARSNEPTFTSALADKHSLDGHSATAPGQLRGEEAQQLKTVKTAAGQDGAHTMATMAGTRVATGQKVGTGKTGAKSRDEEKRAQVTKTLQAVFDRTKCAVEDILTGLDTKVDQQFTAGEKQARDAFTAEHKEGMRQYKKKRYSGPTGWWNWLHDRFLPLPDDANRIYETAKNHYLSAMKQVIAGIADTVERELRRAKDRIAEGRRQLQDTVHRLPADLRAIGEEAAGEFDDRFAELKDTVNAKGTELVDTLATRYTEAVKSVDDEIAKEKEKNRGLLAKAVDAVKGVINTIIELKNMLLGVLRKAAQAISAILKDPIGFLGKLVAAVGGGLKLFMKNVVTHLQQGVLSWLLGTATEAGLQIPARFDIRGILLLIASLLGLTWTNIRSRITRKVPDQAVTAAETAVPLVSQAKRQGIAGMWDELKSRVGDLKKDLVDRLVSYLTPTILIAGITWILSLLNPASAFIRACKMIIDIIRFVITQGRQILEFVNSVLDAVIAIARGGEGGVPALVERALARSIPVLIGALAAILGVGGIAAKVKQIFQALARPVNRAIDWVVDKIVGLVKKLWARLKATFDRMKKPKRRKEHDEAGRPRRPHRPDKPRRPRRDRHPQRRSERDKQRALDAAVHDATHLIEQEGATVKTVRHGLPTIRKRYDLTSIRLVKETGDNYFIELAVNPKERTKTKPLSEAKFPFKIDRAEIAIKVEQVPPVVDRLRRPRIPMRGSDPMVGFVVNMAAIPPEVKPNMAARYLDDAWKGSDERKLAPARTAVVIGVNTFERLDPNADNKGRSAVRNAVRSIKRPARLLLAAFGFVWTPRWVHLGDNRAVQLGPVREAYLGLSPTERQQAVAKNESAWRDRKLPYGVFMEEVFASSYTQRAVDLLSKVNDQVHVFKQDADTAVTTPGGRGVLAQYNDILDAARDEPTLTAGGYTFDGFDWGERADPRTKQLTKLANRLDRAVRVVINRVHPGMLYPTEPNLLIKVWDRNHLNGVFQQARIRALLDSAARARRAAEPDYLARGPEAADRPLLGIGMAEGRNLRIRLREEFRRPDVNRPFSIAYAPSASTGTSPLPGDPTRGLTVTPEDVRGYAAGQRRAEWGLRRRQNQIYGVLMQDQSYANAETLAREFFYANPGLSERDWTFLQDRIFFYVEQVARLMARNPALTERSAPIQRQLAALERSMAKYRISAGGRAAPEVRQAMDRAGVITREIISAMTASELKSLWAELHRLLREIRTQPGPSQEGPR